jgi:hypothetical protein
MLQNTETLTQRFYYQLVGQCFSYFYTTHLHFSAIYPGYLQAVKVWSMCTVYITTSIYAVHVEQNCNSMKMSGFMAETCRSFL